MRLKKAKKADFEEIAKIYGEEFSKAPYNERWTDEKALSKIKTLSKYCDIWKIIYQNKIAGFIAINPNQWRPGETIFGEEMAIKSELQDKGIGTQTLKDIFRYYKKKGYKTFIGIINRNSKAPGLCRKLGFSQSSENILIEGELK